MKDTLLFFVPSFNGYRRLVPASYAPTGISWAMTIAPWPCACPTARRPPPAEHRIAGAEAHPHLVMAGILAGMLEGIEREMEPPPPLSGNAFEGETERLSPSMAAAVEGFLAPTSSPAPSAPTTSASMG